MEARSTSSATAGYDRRTNGWLAFAGTIFVLVGLVNILQGLVAIFDDDYFVARNDGLLVVGFTTWGWFWLILGAVEVAVGFGVFNGSSWARILGVMLVVVNVVVQLAFIAAFPIWTLISIGLNVLLIYALVVPEERYA